MPPKKITKINSPTHAAPKNTGSIVSQYFDLLDKPVKNILRNHQKSMSNLDQKAVFLVDKNLSICIYT